VLAFYCIEPVLNGSRGIISAVRSAGIGKWDENHLYVNKGEPDKKISRPSFRDVTRAGL